MVHCGELSGTTPLILTTWLYIDVEQYGPLLLRTTVEVVRGATHTILLEDGMMWWTHAPVCTNHIRAGARIYEHEIGSSRMHHMPWGMMVNHNLVYLHMWHWTVLWNKSMLTVYSKLKKIAFSTRCSKQNGYDRCDPSCFLYLELEVVIVVGA